MEEVSARRFFSVLITGGVRAALEPEAQGDVALEEDSPGSCRIPSREDVNMGGGGLRENASLDTSGPRGYQKGDKGKS